MYQVWLLGDNKMLLIHSCIGLIVIGDQTALLVISKPQIWSLEQNSCRCIILFKQAFSQHRWADTLREIPVSTMTKGQCRLGPDDFLQPGSWFQLDSEIDASIWCSSIGPIRFLPLWQQTGRHQWWFQSLNQTCSKNSRVWQTVVCNNKLVECSRRDKWLHQGKGVDHNVHMSNRSQQDRLYIL